MLREGTALAAKVGLFLEEIAYFMEAYVLWGVKAGQVRIDVQISCLTT